MPTPNSKKTKPETVPVQAEPKKSEYDLQVNGIPIPYDTTKITADRMIDLLGFEHETEENKFGDKEGEDFFGYDRNGKPFKVNKNTSNRPFDDGLAKAWMTEILKKHWELNGETMIFDDKGQALAAQHRGIGLIWAVQEWKKDTKEGQHWKDVWGDEEPYIRGLIVTGVEGVDRVVNTIDTGKPRSIADSLYRSEIFSTFKKGERKKLAQILEFAVRLIWHRTGAKNDAYTPRRTHSETMDLIVRHPKLIKCAEHIYGETKNSTDDTIDNYLPPGKAAGLMYLMASSKSDATKYNPTGSPNESALNFSNEKLAKEFWVKIAEKNRDFKDLRSALKIMIAPSDEALGHVKATPDEVVAVLVNAWNLFAQGIPVTDSKMGFEVKEIKGFDRLVEKGLKYTKNSSGETVLAEIPTVGGIDRGDPKPEKAPKAEKAPKTERKSSQELDAELAKEVTTELSRLRTDFPNRLFAFPIEGGQSYRFYAGDAAKVAKILDLKPFEWKGIPCLQLSKSDMPIIADKISKAKQVFNLVTLDGDGKATGAVSYNVELEPTETATEEAPVKEGDDLSTAELEQRKAQVLADRAKPKVKPVVRKGPLIQPKRGGLGK